MTQGVNLEWLPPDREQFVPPELDSGHHPSAEDVMGEGLHCLKAHSTQKPGAGLSQAFPSVASSQSADDVSQEIAQALASGEVALARWLVTEGASQPPKYDERRYSARVRPDGFHLIRRHERPPIERTKGGVVVPSVTPTYRPHPHPHRLWNCLPIISGERSGEQAILQEAATAKVASRGAWVGTDTSTDATWDLEPPLQALGARPGNGG